MTTAPHWTPKRRVEKLLDERAELARPLVFVAATEGGPVHVVGPDEDQPGYDSIADWLACRRYRAVCGRVVHLTPLDGYLSRWEDDRLCRSCGTAFWKVDVDAGAAIFEDQGRNDASGAVARIQRDKAYEADCAAGEAA